MTYNGYTEARKRANLKYIAEKTDDVRLRMPKGTKDRWRSYAQKSGKSMTAYIHDAIDAQIAYDECGEHELDQNILPNLINWLRDKGHTAEEITDCLLSLGKE